jgi:hypothetical protein
MRRVAGDSSSTITQLRYAFLLRAMNTAKDRIVLFDPMADDFGSITRQVVLRLEAPHDHVQFGSAKG